LAATVHHQIVIASIGMRAIFSDQEPRETRATEVLYGAPNSGHAGSAVHGQRAFGWPRAEWSNEATKRLLQRKSKAAAMTAVGQ
jgi:hypothetical protein